MDIKELIPKDKFDIETAKKLNDFSIDELRPILPDLLKWLQDINWPVFNSVATYLEKNVEHIQNELLDIFKTDDHIWKYWIIIALGKGIKDDQLRAEIKRIAFLPTHSEKREELDEVALELVNHKKW